MNDTQIDVPYNYDLKPLENVLAGVRRPGDFFVQGSLDAPMPRVEVDGVGVLSFPVTEAQARAVIEQSERAPYGRGADTVLDTAVRNVWQLPPSKVAIGGKSWSRIFEQILAAVTGGLGCDDMNVSAEFYKLLVYDEGAFFKAHRDTEKADGMFGTLLIVLPSPHAGGDLVVRHAGREVTVELGGDEVSELKYAAFYADCEHEVLPVTAGNRVCLVYNLLQQPPRKGKKQGPLVAPTYDDETAATAKLLEKVFAKMDGPAKIAWLLEHQYSPAALSFAALKNADAALAKVLRAAAIQSDCALHLGIVHIEEYGPAEYPVYEFDARYGWGDDEHEDEYASSDDFEVVEVTDGWCYIDHWVNLENDGTGFGKLPLREGEALPAGALDDEVPDEQRVTEATGNEGASFERSYHRAALVIWPREQFVDVLLQAGVHAALPYLEERVASSGRPTTGSDAERAAVRAKALRIIEAWERDVAREETGQVYYDDLDFDDEDWEDLVDDEIYSGTGEAKRADRGRMTALLGQLDDTELLERFVRGVVTTQFDGSEAEALADAAGMLDRKRYGALFSRLVQQNIRTVPRGCVRLLARLIYGQRTDEHPHRNAALRDIGAAIVDGLPVLGSHLSRVVDGGGGHVRKSESVDAEALADLLEGLATLNARQLRDAACAAVVANGNAFDARTVIVPALQTLCKRGNTLSGDTEVVRLWLHAADVLLALSEYPPAPPEDWRQKVVISCRCADCRALQAFALDSVKQSHRFSARKDRRKHLHRRIQQHRLDMTHVTERKGRPYTLVCTKTRQTYERRCNAYRQDVAALAALTALVKKPSGEIAERCERIVAALTLYAKSDYSMIPAHELTLIKEVIDRE